MSQSEPRRDNQVKRKLIFAVQVASFSFIWLFVVGIAAWIINLMRLSVELDDAVGATAAISLVAIPVFVTLASILTYVFVGLQKEERRLETKNGKSGVRAVVVLLALGGLTAGAPFAQPVELPSDILAGRIVFEEKGCVDCHGLGGFGGTDGPDLAADHYYGSFMELASDVWNHIPQMYRKLRREGKEPPRLTYSETLDLFAFLYSLRYLGEPGSAARGRRLLETKGCVRCHRSSDPRRGPDLSRLQEYASPLFMSQTMWNHVPDMVSSTEAEDVVYPLLTGQDIADMTAYITAGFHAGGVHRMSTGNPNRGREIFEVEGCSICHASPTGAGPDLSMSAAQKSVSEIAALMWNHGPEMAEFIEAEGMDWPEFTGTDMADLIAYIYFLGFEDPPGDPDVGRQVLEQKGCIACHQENDEGIAPDFGAIGRLRSPISMVRLMWNHAPAMEEKLLIRNEEWPTLTKEDMQTIYSFLKRTNESERGAPAHPRERRP